MEDRYEIRGKIGQGGLGAVYRGYDTRMNREVAIKRIARSTSDPELQEESTRQLMKEAGALASLQHPHIVTVYDVGTDVDGPYVVMELISGKTLEELIERAPLTWPDFRELALQTQEALIAAQELDLIHSDIKPSNLMLTWLPSGKFQIKIVDFGLATLTQSQSREELQEMEAVFGSIFFMAPEQFERSPLDARSDLYSMGCVYYQSLAGVYPFDGKTGQEVMQAHLHHTVKPLQEIRADIPLWVCDWVMWHINRYPQDRPESARESLSIFLQNDKNPNPTMSMGTAQPANAPKRPRLIIPGSDPVPVAGAPVTAVPAATPTSVLARPAAQATAQVQVQQVPPPPMETPPVESPPVETPAATPPEQPAPADPAPPAVETSSVPTAPDSAVKTVTAPQPLLPPEGFKPSVHTTSISVEPEPEPAQVTATPTRHARVPVPALPQPTGKRKMSNATKGTIAAALGIVILLLAWFLINLSGKRAQTRMYNEMILEAARGDAVEVPVDRKRLEMLLEAATNTGVVEARQTIYKALVLAKANDGTDIDARIAEFATTQPMLPDVREVLIRDVLRQRKNPAVIPTLIAYAIKPGQDPRFAIAAIIAVRFMAGDEEFDSFMNVLRGTDKDDVRKAAEDTMGEIIKDSSKRALLAEKLIEAYKSASDDSVRHALLRLLGHCGGPKAVELVKAALQEPKDKVAAIVTMGNWVDDSVFDTLLGFISTSQDLDERRRAFDSALNFLGNPDAKRDADATREAWQKLAALAKTGDEEIRIIQGIVSINGDWVIKMLESYLESENDRAADLADKALQRAQEMRKIRSGQGE